MRRRVVGAPRGIVVDDASSDGTAEARYTHNQGKRAAMRTTIASAAPRLQHAEPWECQDYGYWVGAAQTPLNPPLVVFQDARNSSTSMSVSCAKSSRLFWSTIS
jgi:glycosyltransferase involved in cell wall biosynthesis